MTAKVKITRDRWFGGVRCNDCDADFEWTRERCRLHVDKTGHTVEYLIRDITSYQPLRSQS